MSIIDISHGLNNATPNYPGDYPLGLSPYKTLEADGYAAYVLSTGMHTGTHIDVPMHLTADTRTAADFPADCFVGKGILLEVRGENIIEMKPHYTKIIESDSIVLLYTGFDEHYHAEEYFTAHPVVSDALGHFLLSRKIKMLGMDMPSPDHTPFALHKALLANGVFLLENLTNLQALSGAGNFEVIALPLKISAEASPVRAVCRAIGSGF